MPLHSCIIVRIASCMFSIQFRVYSFLQCINDTLNYRTYISRPYIDICVAYELAQSVNLRQSKWVRRQYWVDWRLPSRLAPFFHMRTLKVVLVIPGFASSPLHSAGVLWVLYNFNSWNFFAFAEIMLWCISVNQNDVKHEAWPVLLPTDHSNKNWLTKRCYRYLKEYDVYVRSSWYASSYLSGDFGVYQSRISMAYRLPFLLRRKN